MDSDSMENLPPVDVKNASPDGISNTEIGKGDAAKLVSDLNSEILNTVSNSGKEVQQEPDDNSDEDLQLKWDDDDDDDIEEDIISLKLPEDGTPISYNSIAEIDSGKTVMNEQSSDRFISMDVDDADREIIDITDLSSPVPEEEEKSQSNVEKICGIKKEIEETDNEVIKEEENTITIDDTDADEKSKNVEQNTDIVTKDNKQYSDDDLIIIDDDNDDLINTKKNYDVNPVIGDKNDSSDSKMNIEKSNDDKVNDPLTESPEKSFINVSDIQANLEHGLTTPDVMLEIPTQEIIDFENDSDISCNTNESMTKQDTKNNTNTNDDSDVKEKQIDDPTISVEKKSTISKQGDTVLDVINDVEGSKKDEKPDLTLTDKDNTNSLNSIDKNVVKDKTENISLTENNTQLSSKHKENFKQAEDNSDNKLKSLESVISEESQTSVCNSNTIAVIETDTSPTKTDDKLQQSESEKNKTLSLTSTDNNQEPPHSTTDNVNLSVDDQLESVSETTNIDEEIPSTSKIVTNEEATAQTVTLVEPVLPQCRKTKDDQFIRKVIDIDEPSTSQAIFKDDQNPSTSKISNEDQPSTSQFQEDPVPSTSKQSEQLAPDSKDEAPEVTDSLGLLAESSRVREDDEEQDYEEDDDDDFDQDESSNQMTAEHSEDSNAQHSETEVHKDQDEKVTEDKDTPQEEKQEFNFAISNIVTDAVEMEDVKEKDEEMEVMDIVKEVEIKATDQIEEESAVEECTVDKAKTTAEKKIKEIGKDTSTETKQALDIETVKLSDNSDNEAESNDSILMKMLIENKRKEITTKPVEATKSPTKKLEISKPSNVLNYVDLEESSSEDDIQELNKPMSNNIEVDGTNVTIPSNIEVTTSAVSSEATTPKPNRTTRINTNEVTIKTATTESTLTIPEAKDKTMLIQLLEEKSKPKFSLEIFNLDSDEEDNTPASEPPVESPESPAVETVNTRETNKCVNLACKADSKIAFYNADAATMLFYDASRKRKAMVCEECASVVIRRTEGLVNGIKELTPLLDLDILKDSTELVEISDSESEDEAEPADEPKEKIGEKGAAMLEEQLANMINETWFKFKMDDRLNEAEDSLNKEIQKLEDDSKEIDSLLNECQVATDKLRNELYATFEYERHNLAPLIIYDTPANKYSCLESIESTSVKRRLSSGNESTPKRPAIPLGYTPLDHDTKESQVAQPEKPPTSAALETNNIDDDKDIAVLKVSAESAPSDLPPPGELVKPPLKPGMMLYAMKNMFTSWARCRIIECQGESTMPGSIHSFSIYRVKIESNKFRGPVKLLPARCLAYSEPTEVRMTIGTRVIALFKDSGNNEPKKTFFSGIIAEVPNPVNSYRYLVFFDDGYAQYVRHSDTRLVCECSPLVWEEVHPLSREFVREYLVAYPERPMVRLHAGQSLKTEWNGKWWPSRVIEVDASLVKVYFEDDDRSEWIYRGSTRLAPLYLELQAAERHRARPMPRTKQHRVNMPYVEYTRSDEQSKSEEPPPPTPQQTTEQRESRQRAVAKKSTATPQPQLPPPTTDNVISRVVYYTPKNAVKPYKMSAHSCGAHCKRPDVLALKDLRTYNPLAKPLLSGWERQIVRYKGHKEVMYRTPCGRRLRNMRELHRYLRSVQSDMAVDLFDFGPGTHCLAEFVLNTCRVGKKDLSHGKENVPVPCVNYYDDSLPEFCSYNTERTPTAGVPLNLDPEFLCGCDCTDDCVDKSKCACWKMTLEGARTIGLKGTNVGYVYKRLPEPLPSGIYECNSRCKCKQTCLNRVAQHPLQLKLQVFKTLNRGWGIRALNDVPKGSFLCVYAGNLLTDATANMDGLNEGDEYLAELDYIEVVEQMKEGYEEDIPKADKKLDKKNQVNPSEEESEEESSSSEDETTDAREKEDDDDFRPGFLGSGVSEFNKRLRRREKKKEKEDASAKEKDKEEKSDQKEEDCITISDDEEVREPSRFTVQAGMQSNEFISKYRSLRSYFGKDEACYIMDAKVQGNIGRYLNHSCSPNVFVQNVFVDTHDPRFPWVAFFALCHIKAGTELTWNYNYDVGSVPGKVLYCYCGAANCRGRLL